MFIHGPWLNHDASKNDSGTFKELEEVQRSVCLEETVALLTFEVVSADVVLYMQVTQSPRVGGNSFGMGSTLADCID
jgi:hypothetical protein